MLKNVKLEILNETYCEESSISIMEGQTESYDWESQLCCGKCNCLLFFSSKLVNQSEWNLELILKLFLFVNKGNLLGGKSGCAGNKKEFFFFKL